MKILVTGGTGFTGSHLVKHVLREGNKCVVLDNQSSPNPEKEQLLEELKSLGAEVIIGDVTREEDLRRAVAGCDAVYHLAAAFRNINVPKKVYDDTNIGAMRTLLALCKELGVKKLIYCSTQGVHGDIASLSEVPPKPGSEDSPIKPEDYYQYTKHQGELVIAGFLKENPDFDVTIPRPTALYGPGDPARFLMIYKRVKKGWFPFFGKGEAFYHPVYVENFCDAFSLAMSHPASKGQTYIIADDKFYFIKDIVRKIADIEKADGLIKGCRMIHLPFYPMYWLSFAVEAIWKFLPGDPPIFPRRVDWYRQNRGFVIDKARRELEYEPKVKLDEGLKLAYDWYRAHKYL
ncbi:MAG: NAD-dependent epimerase/dehydratase family protein [Kiritimatiellae bacterium]|nr:NAD-dependent epimerase/dehydratase family protein [Kiritimatiellia bacterium]